MAAQTAPFLAVVLNPKHVTVAEAQFADDALRILTLGDIDVPEGAFDGTQLAAGDILGRALGDFISEKQIGARDVVFILPEGSTVTQLIKLPAMPHEDMLGAVRSVAERYAIFAEHAVNVDCATVEEFEEEGSSMSNVLLGASRAANVDQCDECARAAGLDLLAVEAASITVGNAYRESLSQSGVVALAVVGEAKTDVMILEDGVLKLCYSANVGLPEEAEGGDWMTPPSQEQDPFTPPPQLYSELTHCFRFFQHQFPKSTVQRVLLAADHPQADLIASHLAEQLQLPVELNRLNNSIQLPSGVDGERAFTSRALSLALIRGGAFSALRESELLFPINLVPPSSTMWRPVRPYMKAGVAALLVLLVGAAIWANSLGNKISVKEKNLANTQAEIERLEPELAALRAAKATELALYSEVERQTARIARERAVRWSQILVDVSERLPRDMWLIRLSSPDSSRLGLTGLATNRETIPDAINSLGSSPYLENVRLGSLTTDDAYSAGSLVIRYQVNAQLLRGMQPPVNVLATSAPAAQPGPRKEVVSQ